MNPESFLFVIIMKERYYNMKKLLSLLLSITLILSSAAFSHTAFAAEWKSVIKDGVEYCYTVKDKAATITSTSPKKTSSKNSYKTISIPSKLGGYAVKTLAAHSTDCWENIVIPNSVETLEDASVGGYSTKTVKIGSGLKKINGDAFGGCNKLQSISVSSKNKNFTVYKNALYSKGKTKIYKYPASKIPESYTVISSVKTIGDGAFAYSTKLKTLTIGKNVKTIHSNMLNCTTSITKFSVDKKNKYFSVKDGVLFNKKKTTLVLYPCAKSGLSYKIPKGVTKISSRAFRFASKLGEVIFPSTLTEISSKAFQEAYKLKIADLPSKLKKIGSNAFESTAITKLVAPSTLESIGSSAFENCKSLKSVDLSKSKLTKISNRTFCGNTKLNEIKLPKTLKTVLNNAFGDAAITSLDLPASVTKMEEAFGGCYKLKSVTVRGMNTDISNAGFYRTQHIEYRDDEDMEGYTVYKYYITITAKKGSKAEQFALDNGIEFTELT